MAGAPATPAAASARAGGYQDRFAGVSPSSAPASGRCRPFLLVVAVVVQQRRSGERAVGPPH
ncbi:hypothetical protein ACF087_25750 [Streptomyces goshikiensis]|uniref:hypothetical protein n=1 Tax=Streptomyces goshikiensis TaxID=1942 RepID=UPI0036FB59D2